MKRTCVTDIVATQSSPRIAGWINRLSLAVVLSLHLGAVWVFFPPSEALRSEPLYHVDYPVHTHRVYVYREAFFESGLPWGYDPAVSAGSVMSPGSDMGAKPQQVLGFLLPFLDPGTVVRLFLFFVLLTFPLWTLLACYRLGFDDDQRICTMVALLAPAWLFKQFHLFFGWGLVGFAAASYFSVYVLALFVALLCTPRITTYLVFCVAGAVLFLLHFVGPLVLVPALAFYSLVWGGLLWRWRLALWLAPIVIVSVNAFWLLPFLLHLEMPSPGWTRLSVLAHYGHLTYANWSELLDRVVRPLWTGPQAAAIILAVYGFVLMKRFVALPVVISFGVVAMTALFLAYFGSFIPILLNLQPQRFIVPAFVFLTIPVGVAVSHILKRMKLPAGVSMAGIAMLLALPAIFLGWMKSLPLPPSPDPLAEFVAHQTGRSDRLLIQSPDGFRHGGYESKIFPFRFEREVIGSNYSAVHDPAQFLGKVLLGRELKDWSAEELAGAFERWGITWVFTANSEGGALMEELLGAPMAEVGNYKAFRVESSPSRFLIGDGLIETKINRIDLKNLRPESGLVVIRYRYHPAWTATPDFSVVPYSIPEDPSGFIAIKDPPESLILRFDPMAMVNAQWPHKISPSARHDVPTDYNARNPLSRIAAFFVPSK